MLGRVRRLAIRSSRRILAGVSKKSHVADGTIVLWSNFQPPPYGGANQFLLALKKALENRGYTVLKNDWQTPAEAHIFNAMSFDYSHLAQLRKLHPKAVFVHRIDGPMSRYRGTDPSENDDIIFGINEAMDATVFQSAYSLCGCRALGYQAVSPSIVRNAVDPELFHSKDRPERRENKKIRLLSTSWSDNPKKGRDIFAALDRTLDFDRYEYRFLGRCEGKFDNIQVVPPQPSEQVAQALRTADIFVFASAFESASNALIEALACGTPVVYLDSGGNREIVGPAGLAFKEASEIPKLLDTMAGNLDLFRQSISIPSINEIAGNYLTVIDSVRKPCAATSS